MTDKTVQITVTATNDWVTIDGVPCRVWDGRTASGIPIQAVIARVAPRLASEADRTRFAAEMQAAGLRPPTDPVNWQQRIEDEDDARAALAQETERHLLEDERERRLETHRRLLREQEAFDTAQKRLEAERDALRARVEMLEEAAKRQPRIGD